MKKKLNLIIILFFIINSYIITSALEEINYEPKEGDIIFQALPNDCELVKAIEGITRSLYSHCGVILKKDDKWFVIEALNLVSYTPLDKWIARGRDRKFDVYRLKENYNKIIPSFIKNLEKFLGKPYDLKYKMDDKYIYCSELVFKGFKMATGENLGKLEKLGDMNWKPYEEIIKRYEKNSKIPLERVMITPKSLSQAKQLYKVYGTIE